MKEKEYTGTITIQTEYFVDVVNSQSNQKKVVVKLYNAPNPKLKAEPKQIVFKPVVERVDPPPQYITLTNVGTGTLYWTAYDNAGWIEIEPKQGKIGPFKDGFFQKIKVKLKYGWNYMDTSKSSITLITVQAKHPADSVSPKNSPYEKIKVVVDMSDYKKDLILLSPAPNPFSERVFIRFVLGKPTKYLSFRVFDLSGRLVYRKILPGQKEGYYSAIPKGDLNQNGECILWWDGINIYKKKVFYGIYLYTISTDSSTAIGKLCFIKP
jgi:hypothetical protein